MPVSMPVEVSEVSPEAREMPKSVIRAVPSSVIRMLPGLTSRCTISAAWAAASAAATSVPTLATRRGAKVPSARRIS